MSENIGKMIHARPEQKEWADDLVAKFSPDPIPNIIAKVAIDPTDADTKALANILLQYLEVDNKNPAPYLIELMEGDDFELGKFAGMVIADFENGLNVLVETLENESANARMHAAGAIQKLGSSAINAHQALVSCIRKENNDREIILSKALTLKTLAES